MKNKNILQKKFDGKFFDITQEKYIPTNTTWEKLSTESKRTLKRSNWVTKNGRGYEIYIHGFYIPKEPNARKVVFFSYNSYNGKKLCLRF
ncbi:MAG: hypothetical protein WCL02_09630 [bacterium]